MTTYEEIKERWTSESPKLFKKIINFGLSLSGVGTSLVLVPAIVQQYIPTFTVPGIITIVAGYCITIGAVAAAIAKLTACDPPSDSKPKDITNNQP